MSGRCCTTGYRCCGTRECTFSRQPSDEVCRPWVLDAPPARGVLGVGRLGPDVTAVAAVGAAVPAIDRAVGAEQGSVLQTDQVVLVCNRAVRRAQTDLSIRKGLPPDGAGVRLGEDVLAFQKGALAAGHDSVAKTSHFAKPDIGGALMHDWFTHPPPNDRKNYNGTCP